MGLKRWHWCGPTAWPRAMAGYEVAACLQPTTMACAAPRAVRTLMSNKVLDFFFCQIFLSLVNFIEKYSSIFKIKHIYY